MNEGAIGLIIAIGICYVMLTVFIPALFLYRFIKHKSFAVRFAIYQVAGNAWLILVGFVLSFLNIWSGPLVLVLTVVMPLIVNLLVYHRSFFTVWRNYADDKKAGLVTRAGAVRSVRLRFQVNLKKLFDLYIRHHYIEIIILAALFVFAVWYYGYFKIYNFTYASSDEATHLYWVNSLFAGIPFPVGMYPHSMHFTMAAIHSMSGMQTLIINHYFSVIIMLMLHFMLFLCAKSLFRSAAAAVGAVGLYILTDMFTALRYHNTLPMEYGFIAMFAMIILLTEFMKKRDRFSMWMAALATGWTFHAHFYVTIMCAFFWIAFLIVYLKTIIRLKAVLKTLLMILLSAVFAVAPFGVGFLTGHPFEQSIAWAVGVMGISSQDDTALGHMLGKLSGTEAEEEDADNAAGEDSPDASVNGSEEVSAASGSGTEDTSAEENSGGKPAEGDTAAPEKTAAAAGEKTTAAEAAAEVTPEPEPVKPLTSQQIEFQQAQTPGEYMAAAEHLLSLRLTKDDRSALIVWLLIAFGFLYGIIDLIRSHVVFRRKYPKVRAAENPDEDPLTLKARRRERAVKKQEYLIRDGLPIAVPMFILFGTGCFVMSYFGLPELIDDSRAAMILAPVLALLFAIPIRFAEDLLKLIPVRNKKIIETTLLVAVGGGLGAFYAKGPVKQLETVGVYAVTQQLSNELSYDLIATHPQGTWTVISPVNDLLAIRYYGYHYEIIDLLMDIEDGEEVIYMPTNDLYVVTEKKTMNAAGVYYLPNYHQELAEQSFDQDPEQIDVNYYDTGLPWMSPAEAYAGFRNITMVKLNAWMEEIKAAYPNEVEVYSEDDICIVYHIRQSADFPLNLAIDYRKENYGIDARDDFERRYAETYGTEYDPDRF